MRFRSWSTEWGNLDLGLLLTAVCNASGTLWTPAIRPALPLPSPPTFSVVVFVLA